MAFSACMSYPRAIAPPGALLNLLSVVDKKFKIAQLPSSMCAAQFSSSETHESREDAPTAQQRCAVLLWLRFGF